jgi:hypothetical protein
MSRERRRDGIQFILSIISFHNTYSSLKADHIIEDLGRLLEYVNTVHELKDKRHLDGWVCDWLSQSMEHLDKTLSVALDNSAIDKTRMVLLGELVASFLHPIKLAIKVLGHTTN